MNDRLFEDILVISKLEETKVNAIRHHTKEDAAWAVDKIKQSIKAHRFEIADRDKNLDFMHDEHLSKETSCKVIELYLEPKNLIAVIPNRNKEGGELYLFSICVPVRDRKKYIYLKVEITSYGKVVAISWHKQNEMMHADYRQAVDFTDNRILMQMMKVWQRTYNKFAKNTMIGGEVEDDYVIFRFENELDSIDMTNLYKTAPKDFGYKFKDIQNNTEYESNKARIFLPFGKF